MLAPPALPRGHCTQTANFYFFTFHLGYLYLGLGLFISKVYTHSNWYGNSNT